VTVAAFDLGACPAVDARRAHATRATLRACAMLPERWEVELPPLGAAAITPVAIDCDDGRADDVALGLRFGAGAGRVAVDPLFAARVVDRVLGGRAMLPPTVIRALGPAERGVLAAVLAPIWDRLGATVDLGVVPAGSSDVAAIVIRIDAAGASGNVRLTPAAPDAFWGGGCAAVWRGRAGRLPVAAHVEIARTGLLYRELAALVVGDAVVFDGVGADAFAVHASWPGRLRIGGFAAALAVGVGGELTIAGGFSGEQGEEMKMAAADSETDTTEVLASAPVEVVAELGRITIRGDELLGLGAGAVLALGRGRQNVSLCVAGEVWADGEIVDIDGQLGVRVTRVARR
jgi:flagellar motor switch/type III secretory pathway protein FliN